MASVLHVITTINRGGAENHLYSLISAQIDSGMKVSVAYLKGDGYWGQKLEDKGVKTHALGLIEYGDPLPVIRLKKIIEESAPDIVHAHLQPAELYLRLALLFTGKTQPPMCISKHNDEPFYKGPLSGVLGKWVARRASHIIAISDAVRDYFIKDLSSSPEKITTVHYGIDLKGYSDVTKEAAENLRKEWGVPDDAWLIGTVARLVPQKSLHVMIKGYAEYRKKAARPSRLAIVGRGPLQKELQQIAEKSGVADEIIWSGFREDIPVVMKSFDVFALTSSYEGFGLVLLEAMASGKPIAATAVSAIPEVVQSEITGFLSPAGDCGAFADSLKKLEDENIREKMSAAGKERSLREFSVRKMFERTNEIYDKSTQQLNRGGEFSRDLK